MKSGDYGEIDEEKEVVTNVKPFNASKFKENRKN